MIVKNYYPQEKDLNTAEEPYKSVAMLIDRLYIKGPNGKTRITLSFKCPIALSCIRTIAEELSENTVTFVARMKNIWNSLISRNSAFNNEPSLYCVPYAYHLGVIFGGVYYVLVKQKKLSIDYLELLSSYVNKNNEAWPYFEYFKKASNDAERYSSPFLGELVSSVENLQKAGANKEAQLLKVRIKELEDENKALKHKLEGFRAENVSEEETDSEDAKDSNGANDLFRNRVCYEFFLRLLEKAGCTIGLSNNTVIGELGHKVTGRRADKIRQFCSGRKYKNSHTRKQIEELNTMLETIGITEIRL